VASAILDPGGRPIAAFALSVPTVRFDPAVVPRYGALAVAAAERVTDLLD
jgi:DNA-binding IclR family transcriptional regulator